MYCVCVWDNSNEGGAPHRSRAARARTLGTMARNYGVERAEQRGNFAQNTRNNGAEFQHQQTRNFW